MHETATVWKANDPGAAQASANISEQVQAGYGIDVNNIGAPVFCRTRKHALEEAMLSTQYGVGITMYVYVSLVGNGVVLRGSLDDSLGNDQVLPGHS